MEHFSTYSTVWMNYLADPLTGDSMHSVEFGVAPKENPHKVYPVKDGILYISDSPEREHLKAMSEAYDRACREKGWTSPDHFAFRRLPRSGISGWPATYWLQRAYSTAAVWHVLEEARKTKGGLPIGMAGVAADFTLGLPYMAYGLDVAGYITCAVSPHVGEFGLGAYPHTRYGRIQAAWDKIPLRKGVFDVVVFSDSAQDILPEALYQAAELLNPNGYLILTNTSHPEHLASHLQDAGLQVEIQKVRGTEEGLRGLVQKFRTGEIEVPPLVVAQR